eukprot:1129844-Pyramimonas_sp.AAC.1
MSGGRVAVESDRARGRVGRGACAVRQSQGPIPRQCQNRDPRRQGGSHSSTSRTLPPSPMSSGTPGAMLPASPSRRARAASAVAAAMHLHRPA